MFGNFFSNMKNDVRADLEQFVASCRSVVDEYDLQKQLFEYLEKSKKYDLVTREYPIHNSDLPGYEWKSDASVRADIVVKRAGKIVVIELKFVTKEQGATPEHSYLFWKDVRRLECMQHHFGGKMAGGFAVFMTNNPTYEKGPQGEPNYIYFTMAANDPNAGSEKRWADMTTQMAKKHPNFSVSNDHCRVQKWSQTAMNGFRYCTIEI